MTNGEIILLAAYLVSWCTSTLLYIISYNRLLKKYKSIIEKGGKQ